MSSEKELEAIRIFEQALAADENLEWDALKSVGDGDEQLLEILSSLFAADREYSQGAGKLASERTLNIRAALGTKKAVIVDENQVGFSVDGYELVERIGAGGMGEVYRARNVKAGFEHDVALKLLRTMALTNETVRLFEAERNLLAQLKHPNIAALYAGGTTEEGAPYFVLELVSGQTIDTYCDEKSLTVEQRIELVLTVCEAVQHAHSLLIIHRDIKPSNVLVDEQGLVKLLDFGIAKQLSELPKDQTQTVQAAFTPDYASPEQLLGNRVSTVSDVYSLGVLLYKLLTGQLPHLVRTAGAAEVVDIASRLTAPRASERVDETRQMWGKSLTGDLDNVLGKALEKTPADRYQSVQEFSEDLRRYLRGMPVSARVNSWSYRANKFLLRHSLAVGGAIAIAVSLIAITLFSVQQLSIAREERDRATRANDFLKEVLTAPVAGWNSHIKGGRDLKVVDLINELPAEVEKRFVNDPLQKLDLLIAIGMAQYHNNEIDLARKTGEMAQEVVICCAGKATIAHASLLHLQWLIELERGTANATQYIEQAIELVRVLPPDDSAIVITVAYGRHLHQNGEHEKAQVFMDQAIAMNSNPESDDLKRILTVSLSNRSLLAMSNGNLDAALEFIDQSIATYETTSDFLTMEHAAALYNRAAIKRVLGLYDSAAIDNERALNEIKALGGSLVLVDLLFAHHMSLLHLRLGNLEQARHYLGSVEVPENFSEFDVRKRVTVLARGEIALAEAKFDQALQDFRYGIEIYSRAEQSRDQWFALMHSGLSVALFYSGEVESALSHSRTAIEAVDALMSRRFAIADLIKARQNCIDLALPYASCPATNLELMRPIISN